MVIAITNKSEIGTEFIDQVLGLSDVRQRRILLYVDDQENQVKKNQARQKVADYQQRGWKPNGWDVSDAEQDIDMHACFCITETLQDQKLPEYVKSAAVGYESLIYLDSQTTIDRIHFTIFLAHECRHAWQFYLDPVLLHGETALSYVLSAQETPTELDAERFAKRTAYALFGKDTVVDYLKERIRSARQEHKGSWLRLDGLDENQQGDVVSETIRLLLDQAEALRQAQIDCQVQFPQVRIFYNLLSGAEKAKFERALL